MASEYDHKIVSGSLDFPTVQDRTVFYDLMADYVQFYFPRVGESGSILEIERIMRLTSDAEKFLRILIDMWLEDNDTRRVCKLWGEKFECPYALEDPKKFQPPTIDQVHCLYLLVSYLMGRRAEAESQGWQSRMQRRCPASQALEQPVYVFLCLIFKHMVIKNNIAEIEQRNATILFMAVELWLCVLTPHLAMKRLKWEASKPLPISHVTRDNILGCYHFYTTLLVLFLRKIREAFHLSDLGKVEAAVILTKRVLKLYTEDVCLWLRETADYLERVGRTGRVHDLLQSHMETLMMDAEPWRFKDQNVRLEAILMRDDLHNMTKKAQKIQEYKPSFGERFSSLFDFFWDLFDDDASEGGNQPKWDTGAGKEVLKRVRSFGNALSCD